MKKHHLSTALHAGLALVTLLPIWVGLYWELLDTQSPILAVTQSSAADQDGDPKDTSVGRDGVVDRAEGFVVTRKVCASRDVTALVSRHFTDGVRYPLPALVVHLAKGCHSVTGLVDVPYSLPAGPYHYEVSLTVQVNPLISVTQDLPRIPVTLGERLPDPPPGYEGARDGAFPAS